MLLKEQALTTARGMWDKGTRLSGKNRKYWFKEKKEMGKGNSGKRQKQRGATRNENGIHC